MTYLLDTNAWVAHLRQKNRGLTQRLLQETPGNIALCSMVLAELYYGAARSGPRHEAGNRAAIANLRQQFVSLRFDDAAAEEYGSLRTHLEMLGFPIGPNDLIIAAIALSNGLTLVTHNTAEFSRVPGLLIEDWQTP